MGVKGEILTKSPVVSSQNDNIGKRKMTEKYCLKRRRGGQKGNQNARKHGFYSRSLNPTELCDFLNLVNLQSVDREIAVIDIKLKSAFAQNPVNRRVILEGAKLLAGLLISRYHLKGEARIFMRDFLRQLLVARASNEPFDPSALPFLQNESSVSSAVKDSFSEFFSREKALK